MIVVSSCSCFWPIHWSQVLSWEWRCSRSSADRRSLNYIWVITIASYIGGLTVDLFLVSRGPGNLTYLPLDKMAAIFQKTFSNACSGNEKFCILIQTSLKFVPKGLFDKKLALVQVMAWCRTGNKPLSEPKRSSSLTHTCGTWGRWVNIVW